MIDYALETRNLTKHMGGRRIVRSVSLQIPKGSVYGLLGPNGAGKSTTLKLLTGLMCPSEGEVRIFGKPWSRDCLGRIGALIETPALYGNLTAYENLLVHSRLRGLPQGEIDKVLVITGLEATGKQLVSQFSLGMKQRLGLAIALLGDPEILILDEPTNGLDPAGIRELRDFIRTLARDEGIGVFISSHILHEVQLMCDRVAIISQGQLLRTDRVDRLIDGDALVVEWRMEPPARGAELLKTLPYVTHVERRDHRILSQLPEERIGETVRTLVDAGILVTGIHRRGKTLEDIFLQLTEGDPIA